MAYATVNEFKESIGNIKSMAAGSIENMQRALNAAENAIDVAMNRSEGFKAAAAASYHYYSACGLDVVWIDECVEISEVAVKQFRSSTTYTALASPTSMMAGDGDWMPMPFNAPAKNKPYNRVTIDPNGNYAVFTDGLGLPTVRINARWGYSATTPALIKMVCIAQAGRWYNQMAGGMSDFVASPDTGELKYSRSLAVEFVKMLKQAGFWNPPI